MFRGISTGINENYGKKGEEREYGDHHLLTGIRKGWIEPNSFEYLGRKSASTIKKKEQISIMTVKAYNLLAIFELQNKRLASLQTALEAMTDTNKRLIAVVKEKVKK